MSKVDLTGRPICITGASSGVGRATAVACAAAGMPVLCAARREDKLKDVVEEITSRGGRAQYAVVDVADADACAAMIDTAVASFGSIYAVFANAGVGLDRPMYQMSDAELREIFEINFFGSMNTVRPALPRFIQQGAGHVLFCSSCLAKLTLPYHGAYTATKAAQNHVARAMRLELEPMGVAVSTVLPVGVATEFLSVKQARSGGSELAKHTPGWLVQPPERVARAVVKCLRKPRAEVWTFRPVLWGMAMATAAPSLADRHLRKMVRRRRSMANDPQ